MRYEPYTAADGEKFKLGALPPAKDITLREVRKQMRIYMDMEVRSKQEADGVVRDKGTLFEIACLRRALELLPKRTRDISKNI